MVELKIGQTFEEQIDGEDNNCDPHEYTGRIYQRGDEYLMFCQVSYGGFSFVNMSSGNRMNDETLLRDEYVNKHVDIKYREGRAVLNEINTLLDEDIIYCGRLNEWLAGLEY